MKLFGTDGIRGKSNEYPVTPEVALRIGQAAVKVLGKKILIGRDTRDSGPMIENALAAGIVSAGGKALLSGILPSSAVAYLIQEAGADAGVVISASHNPAQDNGIKFFSKEGIKLSEKQEKSLEDTFFSRKNLKNTVGDVVSYDCAQEKYIEFVKGCGSPLEGLKICTDCSNGAAYKVAPEIYRQLGAHVITYFSEPDGTNINSGCGALEPEIIAEKVVENNADAGVVFDGDADRVIMVDEKGRVLDGDHILAILAMHLKKQNKLKKNTLVVTVYSNVGLEKTMNNNNISLIRTKVGDKQVIDKMLAEGYSLGGEQSGHIIMGDYLKTGDGIIASLKVLELMNNKKLSELVCIEKAPQVLVNVEVDEKKPLEEIPGFIKRVSQVKKILGENGRVYIRYSGTQDLLRIMVEGKGEIEKHANYIAEVVK